MIYLALFDFVPNIAFLVGAYFLVRFACMARGKICGGMITFGSALILLGGFLQALWKLLYASGMADIRSMSNLQFVLMAPGFVILLLALILIMGPSIRKTSLPLLMVANWKLPFLMTMVVSSIAAQGLLAYISFRRHSFAACAGFVIALIGLLAMGGMSSSEQTVAMQWTEEITNAIGQTAFATASFLLFQNFKSTEPKI